VQISTPSCRVSRIERVNGTYRTTQLLHTQAQAKCQRAEAQLGKIHQQLGVDPKTDLVRIIKVHLEARHVRRLGRPHTRVRELGVLRTKVDVSHGDLVQHVHRAPGHGRVEHMLGQALSRGLLCILQRRHPALGVRRRRASGCVPHNRVSIPRDHLREDHIEPVERLRGMCAHLVLGLLQHILQAAAHNLAVGRRRTPTEFGFERSLDRLGARNQRAALLFQRGG